MSLRVVLAGHNLDRDLILEIRALLEELLRAESDSARRALQERVRAALALDNWTPETISAAYARVSRDPRSVSELRAVARAEVDRARRSNEAIVHGLGHASVAEHAVFNFDVMGLSRLAVESLERRRLASFTEKSQRYILLDEDWVLPEEIRGTPAEDEFRRLVADQHRFYREAHDTLLPAFRAEITTAGTERERERVARGMAQEDARYGLGLSTTVQLGVTLNARNLEGLLARCAAHPLDEVRALGNAFRDAAAGLAPSLVKYTEPTPYLREARSRLAEAVAEVTRTPAPAGLAGSSGYPVQDEVRLLGTTPDPDLALVAALLFTGGAGPMEACRARAASLDADGRRRVALSHLSLLGPHDVVLREYELVAAEFEVVVSAACYAQLKRHRMATLVPLSYDPGLDLTVPVSLERAGLGKALRRLAERSAGVWRTIGSMAPPAAGYALVNAQRRRVLVRMNARELHHFSRLREDVHAQWDIRRLAARMLALARERMPLVLALAAGKDEFANRHRELFPEGGAREKDRS